MKENRYCIKCGDIIPSYIVVDNRRLWASKSRINCFKCSIVRKRRTGIRPRIPLIYRSCSVCGKEKYYKGTKCRTCVSTERRIVAKLKAIKFAGGSCTKCGWKNHPAALEFHHINGEKDFAIGNRWNANWELLAKEISKCQLLCSNCHRIEHSKRFDPFLKEFLST